jgi:hypothetical protein
LNTKANPPYLRKSGSANWICDAEIIVEKLKCKNTQPIYINSTIKPGILCETRSRFYLSNKLFSQRASCLLATTG